MIHSLIVWGVLTCRPPYHHESACNLPYNMYVVELDRPAESVFDRSFERGRGPVILVSFSSPPPSPASSHAHSSSKLCHHAHPSSVRARHERALCAVCAGVRLPVCLPAPSASSLPPPSVASLRRAGRTRAGPRARERCERRQRGACGCALAFSRGACGCALAFSRASRSALKKRALVALRKAAVPPAAWEPKKGELAFLKNRGSYVFIDVYEVATTIVVGIEYDELERVAYKNASPTEYRRKMLLRPPQRAGEVSAGMRVYALDTKFQTFHEAEVQATASGLAYRWIDYPDHDATPVTTADVVYLLEEQAGCLKRAAEPRAGSLKERSSCSESDSGSESDDEPKQKRAKPATDNKRRPAQQHAASTAAAALKPPQPTQRPEVPAPASSPAPHHIIRSKPITATQQTVPYEWVPDIAYIHARIRAEREAREA